MVLIVLDAAAPLDAEDKALIQAADERAIVCLNKQDLPAIITSEQIAALTPAKLCMISAESGQGIPELISEISRRIAITDESDGQLVTQRHLELARNAASNLQSAISALQSGMPLDTVAIDLREALVQLGEITGQNATEEVIDRVFSTFCVGK